MKRHVKCKNGKYMNSFGPAVSRKSKQSFRDKIRATRIKSRMATIETLAEELNPIIRGWYNYFSKFYKSEARKVLEFVNQNILIWAKKKLGRLKRSNFKAWKYLSKVAKANPDLFYQWSIWIKPTFKITRAV